ncbi:hypothetical protein [Rhodococcus jostii]|uniref:Uncharacterized protein n=1 Tax=Rhodococcus jostii TaxID=132919 RepID=A0A1H5CJP4_RHOJO|nr:hypothetical protein SAMN04490220_5154 [Rhodococcus jostii]
MDEPGAPEDLTRRIAHLAREFFLPHDVDRTLRRVTATAVATVSGADSAGILVVEGKKTFASQAGTSDLPEQLDGIQEKLGEGPSVRPRA